MPVENMFRYESPHDSENQLTAHVEGDGLCVAVSNEQAVDSYNHTFTCDIFLPWDAMVALRDYLNSQTEPQPDSMETK